MKRYSHAELTALKQFATPKQLAVLNALITHDSCKEAAKALGKADNIARTVGALRATARRRGFDAAAGWTNKPVPPGFEVHGVSDRVDSEGNRQQAWLKSRAATTPEANEAAKRPPGHLVKRTAVLRDARGDVRAFWESTEAEKVAQYEATIKAWERHAVLYKGLAGRLTAPDPTTLDDDLIGVLPIGDPHIGLLSWAPETGDHQDTGIVCRELLCCVRQLIHEMPACPHIIIGNLGDALHAQDDNNRTPGHGNVLDVDGRFAKVLDAAHVVFRGIVDAARAKFGRVTFRNLPGNHDPRVAVELMMWLRAVYENEPRVSIADAFAVHQYDRFGTNLIGWHHGDRSKKGELPAIMASDHDGGGTGWWGETTEHVWHVGHEHHTTVLETPSCLVHVHNTLVGRDAYHAGRYRAKRMLEAYTYHRLFGLHNSNTVSLARVRAALAAGGK